MKYLKNTILTGRKGSALSLKNEEEDAPFTVRNLFIFVAENMQAGDVETYRKINSALDALELQRKTNAPYVEFEDEWYALIKPEVLKVILKLGRHSPYVVDELERLEKEGRQVERVEGESEDNVCSVKSSPYWTQ